MRKEENLKKNEYSSRYCVLSTTTLFLLIFFSVHFLSNPIKVNASATRGSIDNTYRYAKGIDDPDIKIDFDLFEGGIGVTVTDTALTGFAWGNKIGWINLSPSNGGVLNNNEGNLSGYAISEFGGWIDFTGVTINSSGEFLGYAKSQNFGRIVFNCVTNNSCAAEDFKVRTDWRPVSVRTNTTPHPISVPISLPPVITTTTAPTEVQEQTPPITSTPKPLPISTNVSQYESGGDVIVNNKTTEESDENKTGGQTTRVLTPEEQGTKTGIINNQNPIQTIPADLAPISVTKSTVVATISKDIQTTTNQITKEATVVANTPAVNFSTKAVSTVGAAGGGTAIVTSFAGSAVSFPEFLLIFFRFWNILLSTLGFKKRRAPWGTVYDSVTKQPLDPAYVILEDRTGKEVATSITDLDGRFGFLVPPGKYFLKVKKTNYTFPSSKLFNEYRDEVYDNLYFGEAVELEENKTILKNIPMDPQGLDWNEFMKRDKKLLKFHSPWSYIFAQITGVLFWSGFVLALIILAIKPDFYNIIIIIIYAVLIFLRRTNIKSKSYGTITYKDSGFPASFAIVRVFVKEKKEEVFHRVADEFGHYFCLLPKGEYYITIEKKNADESYTKVYTSEIIPVKNGIINKDFSV